MKKLMLLFLLLLLPVAVAQTSFTFPESTPTDLKVSCFNENNSLCDTTTECLLTIDYPNATNLIKNESMTYNFNYFNFTLNENQTTPSGEYSVSVACQGQEVGFTTFTYEVNPTGIRPSESRTQATTRAIWFIAIFGILLFIAGLLVQMNSTVKLTIFALSFIVFLVGINIVFISLQDEVINPRLENLFSFLTSISFILLWAVGGFLVILWMFTFLNTWLFKKNMANAQRFGGANFG